MTEAFVTIDTEYDAIYVPVSHLRAVADGDMAISDLEDYEAIVPAIVDHWLAVVLQEHETRH